MIQGIRTSFHRFSVLIHNKALKNYAFINMLSLAISKLIKF